MKLPSFKTCLISITGILFIISCTKTTTNKPFACGDTITDVDGNIYSTVSIGTQCWMKENLKTSKYKDGTAIPTGLDNTAWAADSIGAYAVYNNADSNNTRYGKLYNWYAVHTGKLAPAGWHVPDTTEWSTLVNFLGGENVAGGAMKSTTLWNSPNTGATNSSGFNGLPAGYRDGFDGLFYEIGYSGNFWLSTVGTNYAFDRYLNSNNSNASKATTNMGNGFSVRCVRD